MPRLNQNSRMPRPFPAWAAIGIVLAIVGLVVWIPVRHPPAQTQSKAFANYDGSESCSESHREEYDQWAKFNIGLAEQWADSNTCQAAFATTNTVGRAGQPAELIVRDGKYEVTATNEGGQLETHQVDRVIGRDPLVQFLVSAPGGRWQALSSAWDPRRKEWFEVFGAEERLPGEWGHWTGRGMNWNSMCAACHNTALRKNYDTATDSYHTAMAEMSVGCEACHGPLQSHVQWQHRSAKAGSKDPTLAPMSRKQKLDACGACHARRSELTGDFKPGVNFLDHFELAMVDGTDLYYPDGQVHEEDYEYASFLGSRMHASGVECMDCHQPHSAKLRWPGNFLCLRCHDGSRTNAPVINPLAHSHHQVRGYSLDGKLIDKDLTHFKSDGFKETGGECVNCHMPQTVYMQRHARYDHGMTIPDPLLTKEFGVPNACNRCHKDKDADWALAHVDKWYGKLMDRPTRQRARLLAEGRVSNVAVLEPLLKMLATETNAYWKAALISVLPLWANESQIDAVLQQSLSDGNALVRKKAGRERDGGVVLCARGWRARFAWCVSRQLGLCAPTWTRIARPAGNWIYFLTSMPISRAANCRRGSFLLPEANRRKLLNTIARLLLGTRPPLPSATTWPCSTACSIKITRRWSNCAKPCAWNRGRRSIITASRWLSTKPAIWQRPSLSSRKPPALIRAMPTPGATSDWRGRPRKI